LSTSSAPTATLADIPSLLLAMPVDDALFVLNKVLAEHSFSEFVKQAWNVVEPGRPLVWGWHLQAKCDHLQAVYNHTVPEEIDPYAKVQVGIQSLIINEPPRCSKSLFSSVFFNAWIWAKWPGARFLCVTYADDLAQRDALKTRSLIESSWYQQRWPLKISEDQSAKKRYNIDKWNPKTRGYEDAGGFRVSTTILGMATGEGGDFRVIDDPHNVKKSLSDVERKQANQFFDLTLPTRVVDPHRYSTVITMQRLHGDDLTGHATSGDNKWDMLVLPMEYEAQEGNRCSTALGFIDPRTKEGELLHPERWPAKAVQEAKNDLRLELGDFGTNSQFQQRPTPLGGGMFQPDNLIMVSSWPELRDLERIVRYWDKAGTEGDGAYTSGALMAKRKSTQRSIILDVTRGQWGTDKREAEIKNIAYQDLQKLGGKSGNFEILVEQEPGSGGKDSALWTIRNLSGFRVKRIPKRDSKEAEWSPFASQVNAGGVEMVVGPWNKETKAQMAGAPFAKFKDDLDSTSGAFKHIWLGPRAGVLG